MRETRTQINKHYIFFYFENIISHSQSRKIEIGTLSDNSGSLWSSSQEVAWIGGENI